MEPPDVSEVSDEYFANEDDEVSEWLYGSQLLVTPEICRHRVDVNNEGEHDNDEPHKETNRHPSMKAERMRHEPLKWKV